MSKIDNFNIDKIIQTPSVSYWKIRLVVTIVMLLLAFIGLILTYINPVDSTISWYFWLAMGPVYALLAIFLAIYFHRRKSQNTVLSVWYEILHWIAFIIILFVLHVYVHTGIIGRFEGGLFILSILAFSVLISGIYLDSTFLVVGIVLTIFALVMSLLTKYMAILLIGVVMLIAATVMFFMVKRKVSTDTEEIGLKQAGREKFNKK